MLNGEFTRFYFFHLSTDKLSDLSFLCGVLVNTVRLGYLLDTKDRSTIVMASRLLTDLNCTSRGEPIILDWLPYTITLALFTYFL